MVEDAGLLDWSLQHVRFSAFLPSVLEDNSELSRARFQRLFQRDPSSEERRGALRMMRLVATEATKQFELLEQVNRLDATVTGLPDVLVMGSLGASADPISSFREIEQFHSLGKGLLQEAGSPFRVALGAMLHFQTSGPDESYKVLSKLIPHLGLEYSKFRDFNLQLNMPLEASLDGGSFTLNRLWTLTPLRMALTAITSGLQPTGVEKHVVQMALDINTDALRTEPFLPDQFEALLKILFDGAYAAARGLHG